ncbi:hypothetical protein CEXT_144541 [Caerostris extrusa]|uniref:Transposase n=1 Tax=Caerostris extrusa TaxID=172846 RepID=A0AAV4Y9M3_CAEEX|nr:hypothetical protein CEXT_144541 [Caerostris extrusa]
MPKISSQLINDRNCVGAHWFTEMHLFLSGFEMWLLCAAPPTKKLTDLIELLDARGRDFVSRFFFHRLRASLTAIRMKHERIACT